jgi:hypothetical protein
VSAETFRAIVKKSKLTGKTNHDCQDMQDDYVNTEGVILATHEMIACADIYQVRRELFDNYILTASLKHAG